MVAAIFNVLFEVRSYTVNSKMLVLFVRRGAICIRGVRCISQQLASSRSTVIKSEVHKFEKFSQSFWDVNGPMKPLHALNKLRVPLICEGILNSTSGKKSHQSQVPLPLEGFSILDVGCGGGILSESLARLGAYVKGIDPCGENIVVATQHAANRQHLQLRLSYESATIEDLKQRGEKAFDAVVASEVIEHVEDPQFFIQTCSDLLKPGGSLFITTINRTSASRLIAVTAAESVLRVIPQGTHDWNKFITPDELTSYLSHSNCQLRLLHGMLYNPLTNNFTWVPYTGVNYAIQAVKAKSAPDFAVPPKTDIENLQKSGETRI